MDYRLGIFSKMTWVVTALFLLNGCSGCSGNNPSNIDNSTAPLPVLSFDELQIAIAEGDAGGPILVFNLSLDKPATSDVSVDYVTQDGTAVSPWDYSAQSGTLTLIKGQTHASIAIDITPEVCFETDESLLLTLSNVTAAATLSANNAATGVILNDDSKRVLSIQGASQDEGDSLNTMTFNLALDRSSCQDIDVSYSTINGGGVVLDATDNNDLTHQNNQILTIAAGSTQASIDIQILGDTSVETDEAFSVQIATSASQVSLANDNAQGVILDDDDSGNTGGGGNIALITIADVGLDEGDSGNQIMIFSVSLSKAVADTVTVDYSTLSQGSATAGVDYNSSSGTLTFAAGEQEQQFTVSIVGDTDAEADENFLVELSNVSGDAQIGNANASGVIRNDDGSIAPIEVSIGDISQLEGDTQVTDFVFTVSLDRVASEDISFSYSSTHITTDNNDFSTVSNIAGLISTGNTQTSITIPVIGDTDLEDDESFSVTLSNLSTNATFVDAVAIANVINDDGSSGWQTPQDLGQGQNPGIISDATGNAAVIWQAQGDPLDGLDDIRAAMFSAGVWQPSDLLAQPSSVIEIDPAIAMLANGEAIALWRGFPEFGSSVSQNGNWVDAAVPANVSLNWSIKLAGSTHGNAFAVGEEGTLPENSWIIPYDSTNGWGSEMALQLDVSDVNFADASDARDPLIVMNPSGNALVTWKQGFNNFALSQVYYRYYDVSTSSWSIAKPVADTSGFTVPNQIVMYDNGDAAMIGINDIGSGTVEAWFYDRINDLWTKSPDLGSGAQATAPRIAIAGTNDLFAVWSTQDFFNIYSNRFDYIAGTWGSTPELLSIAGGASGTHPDLAADTNGNAIVVWIQDINNASFPDPTQFRARASRYSVIDDQWSAAENIDDSNLGQVIEDPKIAMDDLGNAHVVWRYSSGNVGSNRYLAP